MEAEAVLAGWLRFRLPCDRGAVPCIRNEPVYNGVTFDGHRTGGIGMSQVAADADRLFAEGRIVKVAGKWEVSRVVWRSPVCIVCGVKFKYVKRGDTKYCSKDCKKRANRAAAYMNRMSDQLEKRCQWCGVGRLHDPRQSYCSAACKQAAYRARRKSGDQLMF